MRRLLYLALLGAPGWLAGVALAGPSVDAEFAARIADAKQWKPWIAGLATLLVTADWLLARSGRDAVASRSRAGLLVALGFATLFVWWHPYRLDAAHWLHERDAFHYYVGGKYFDELRYTRLYRCTYVADVEAGLARELVGSRIRNLETNALEDPRPLVDDPSACKDHFTPERWKAFTRDVSFFRAGMDRASWFQLRVDHGYNPPPSWTMIGRPLASTGPATRAQLAWLVAIDPLLLLGMFAAVGWAFGWRIACVAFVYWGTNQPAMWNWVGGSLVRFDWLVASVVAVCLLARGRPALSGALFAWAVGVRVFPGAFVGGVALAALVRMVGERTLRPTKAQLRFAGGFAVGLAAIVGVSAIAVGPGSWSEFVRNSRTHLATDSVNRIGLRPVLAYSQSSSLARTVRPGTAEPFAKWRQARRATFESRRALHVGLIVGYLALLAWAVRRPPDWVAAVLGVGVVPIALEVGCYYTGFLLSFALLGRAYAWVSPLLLLLATLSWSFGTWGGPDRDAVMAGIGLLIVIFVFATTAGVAFGRPQWEDD